MSDFIREVNEDYRRDRVVNFLVKNQLLLIGLTLAIIIGTAGFWIFLHNQNQAAATASLQYEAAVQLARAGKNAEAQAAFDKIQADAPPGYASLARLRAVEALASHDPAAAVHGYDAMAADDTADATLRDVAQLRGALIRIDSEDPLVFEKRYAPLAIQGFTFHSSLRELLAMAAFKRNDIEAAGRWLDEIVVDPQAPAALRGRAEAFLSLVAAGPAEAGTPEPPKPVLPSPPETAESPASPEKAESPASPAAASPKQSTTPATPPTPVSPGVTPSVTTPTQSSSTPIPSTPNPSTPIPPVETQPAH